MSRPLPDGFFERSVHAVARDLIGCTLWFGDCAGVIVETESYDQDDPACHGYGGRTARNEVLFGPPGRAYVYLSYGLHSLLNFVAEPEGRAAAALVRALAPLEGVEAMRERRGRRDLRDLCSGPGKLSQALGIGLGVNGSLLDGPPFRLAAPEGAWRKVEVLSGPRIGITRATERPWRYCAAGSEHVSRPWPA
ncbi:MAG: DNA-3-methyladenine glycosylase [Solirubrobacterales bacterium]